MTQETTAVDTSWCFGCGKENPIGLKLDMKEIDGVWTAYFTPKKMHGGLTSTLLDEVMGDCVFRKAGRPAYTAKLEIRFRSAVRIGETVKVEGWITSCRGRLVTAEGRVVHEDGSVAAESSAKMMLAK